MLDIFRINNSKYGSVRLYGSGISLDGILQNDLGISGANSWDNSFLFSGAAEEALEGKAMLQRTATRWSGGRAGADRGATNQDMSKYSWTGSARPEFTVEIALVALKDTEKYDVVGKSMQAMRTVYPDSELGFLTAPLGYSSGQAANGGKSKYVAGTVNLRVGKWFNAYGLIVKSVNFTYSKVCLKSGKPLFALGSISLEPFKAITYSEFRSYFKV